MWSAVKPVASQKLATYVLGKKIDFLYPLVWLFSTDEQVPVTGKVGRSMRRYGYSKVDIILEENLGGQPL